MCTKLYNLFFVHQQIIGVQTNWYFQHRAYEQECFGSNTENNNFRNQRTVRSHDRSWVLVDKTAQDRTRTGSISAGILHSGCVVPRQLPLPLSDRVRTAPTGTPSSFRSSVKLTEKSDCLLLCIEKDKNVFSFGICHVCQQQLDLIS